MKIILYSYCGRRITLYIKINLVRFFWIEHFYFYDMRFLWRANYVVFTGVECSTINYLSKRNKYINLRIFFFSEISKQQPICELDSYSMIMQTTLWVKSMRPFFTDLRITMACLDYTIADWSSLLHVSGWKKVLGLDSYGRYPN